MTSGYVVLKRVETKRELEEISMSRDHMNKDYTENAWEEYLRKEGERVDSMKKEKEEEEERKEEKKEKDKESAIHPGYISAAFGPELHGAVEEYYKEEPDVIKNPPHYMVLDNVEAKDIIKELTKGLGAWNSYCYGNVLKYVLRATKKGAFAQDLQKCKQYIEMMNLP